MIFNKSIDVHWVPIAGKDLEDMKRLKSVPEMLWYEPEPVLKHFVQERDKHIAFLKCPAVVDLYKNVFLIRSPMDVSISIVRDDKGNCVIREHAQLPRFADDFIIHRDPAQNCRFEMLSICFCYLMYSRKELMLEIMHPTLSGHISTGLRGLNLMCAKYDISKWIRPLEFAFEVHEDTERIDIKRGDPLYYIKFHTDKKINFIRGDIDSAFDVMSSCLSIKAFVKGNSLKKNYELAAPLIERNKNKLFGKKCPFGFGK